MVSSSFQCVGGSSEIKAKKMKNRESRGLKHDMSKAEKDQLEQNSKHFDKRIIESLRDRQRKKRSTGIMICYISFIICQI